MFKAHRLLYHSTPGLRVIKKKVCGQKSISGTISWIILQKWFIF